MGIHVCFGSLANMRGDINALPTNNAIIISSADHIIDAYAKTHLFSPAHEHLFVSPGMRFSKVFTINDTLSAVLICHDICFPELFRHSQVKLIAWLILHLGRIQD